jgi:hypothetical protein
MKLQNQTAVKIEPQYGLAAIDAYLESEAAAYRMGDVGKLARRSAATRTRAYFRVWHNPDQIQPRPTPQVGAFAFANHARANEVAPSTR